MEDIRDIEARTAKRVADAEAKVKRAVRKAPLRDKAVDAKRDANKRAAGKRKKKSKAHKASCLSSLHGELYSGASLHAIEAAAPLYVPGTRLPGIGVSHSGVSNNYVA